MESNYEKEMNKRNEKIPYEKEMNKRNEKIPYEKEMKKEMKRSQILRIVLGGQLLISTLKLFWEGGGEGGGDPYTNQHPTLRPFSTFNPTFESILFRQLLNLSETQQARQLTLG